MYILYYMYCLDNQSLKWIFFFSVRNENLNLLVWIKFLNLFYIYINKNWKIYWSEQSFTGLGLESQCSSWGLDNVILFHCGYLRIILLFQSMGRGGGGFNDFGQNGGGSEVYLLLIHFTIFVWYLRLIDHFFKLWWCNV
jgi:hypothetical protein